MRCSATSPAAVAPPPEYIQRGRRSYLAWADALDRPGTYTPWLRPEPRPPLEARPTRLSVSSIEQWRRDPYGLYARRILGLDALDPLEAELGAADRGEALHDALDEFLRSHPSGLLPADAVGRVRGAGREASRRAARRRRPSAPSGGRASSAWRAGSSATENERRARRHKAAGERNHRRAHRRADRSAAAHRGARRPHRRGRTRRLGDHRLQDRPRALQGRAGSPVRAPAPARGGDGRARRLRRHQGQGTVRCSSPTGRPTAWATAAR